MSIFKYPLEEEDKESHSFSPRSYEVKDIFFNHFHFVEESKTTRLVDRKDSVINLTLRHVHVAGNGK